MGTLFGDNTFGSGNFGDTANVVITPPTFVVTGTVGSSLAGALTFATPSSVEASATPGTITFTRNAIIFAPTAAAFGIVGPVSFGTNVSPDTLSAVSTVFDVQEVDTGVSVVAPTTFHLQAAMGHVSIATTTTAPPPPVDTATSAVLYAVYPFRDFVYSPAFVRQRHRFRGQRESYKFNAEISSFLIDILKLYERADSLNNTLDINNEAMLQGGSVDNAVFFDSTQALVQQPETFGAFGITFGQAAGTFGNWGGTDTLVAVPKSFDFKGIDELGLRLEKLRYRVGTLERALL